MHRLQTIFVQGTRLSLATVVPMGGTMIIMAGPLVRAWVGPDFSGSVLVVRLLCLSVIVRVANETASTILKGAGEHRLLAFVNMATACVNLALSIAIVKPLGLPGVALGTLVPICFTAMLVLFPAACRRVELSLRRALVEAVWPAIWPASVMTAFLLATRDWVPTTLIAVGAEMAAACAIYALIFVFFGIDANQRRVYTLKAMKMLHRAPPACDPISEGA
jgi:O-antigen/teichoic acid export membrane protein